VYKATACMQLHNASCAAAAAAAVAYILLSLAEML
jgi:hypothetical protein